MSRLLVVLIALTIAALGLWSSSSALPILVPRTQCFRCPPTNPDGQSNYIQETYGDHLKCFYGDSTIACTYDPNTGAFRTYKPECPIRAKLSRCAAVSKDHLPPKRPKPAEKPGSIAGLMQGKGWKMGDAEREEQARLVREQLAALQRQK